MINLFILWFNHTFSMISISILITTYAVRTPIVTILEIIIAFMVGLRLGNKCSEEIAIQEEELEEEDVS